MEPTDFKNVIVENIPPALFEDAEVKRPRNSKQGKFYYENINYVVSQILKLSCVSFTHVSISYVLAGSTDQNVL